MAKAAATFGKVAGLAIAAAGAVVLGACAVVPRLRALRERREAARLREAEEQRIRRAEREENERVEREELERAERARLERLQRESEELVARGRACSECGREIRPIRVRRVADGVIVSYRCSRDLCGRLQERTRSFDDLQADERSLLANRGG